FSPTNDSNIILYFLHSIKSPLRILCSIIVSTVTISLGFVEYSIPLILLLKSPSTQALITISEIAPLPSPLPPYTIILHYLQLIYHIISLILFLCFLLRAHLYYFLKYLVPVSISHFPLLHT